MGCVFALGWLISLLLLAHAEEKGGVTLAEWLEVSCSDLA